MAGLVVSALAVAGGCASLFQNPSVRILDVRVASLGLTSGRALVDLEVVNPNRFSLRVQSFDYVLEIEDGDGSDEWAELATGRAPEAIPVAGRDTAVVSLDVPFQYRAVQSAIGAYLREGRVGYRFRGDALVRGPLGNVELPFSQRGVID